MHIGLNHGAVLVGAVVVGRDAAGAEVHALTHRGVTQVSQVVGLGAAAQGGVFHFDKVTDMHLGTQLRARAQPGKGADQRAGTDLHAQLFAVDVREGMDHRAGVDAGVGNDTVGAYSHAVT